MRGLSIGKGLLWLVIVALAVLTWPRDGNMCKPGPAGARIVTRLPMVIQQYRDRSEGRLPQSWQQIADSPGCALDILASARKSLALDARYRFLPPGEFLVRPGDGKEEVLVMEANGEGDAATIQYTLGIPHVWQKQRYCIVRTATGTIEHRKYSEALLSKWIDLAKYTSPAPVSPGFHPKIWFSPNDSRSVPLLSLALFGWAAFRLVGWFRNGKSRQLRETK